MTIILRTTAFWAGQGFFEVLSRASFDQPNGMHWPRAGRRNCPPGCCPLPFSGATWTEQRTRPTIEVCDDARRVRERRLSALETTSLTHCLSPHVLLTVHQPDLRSFLELPQRQNGISVYSSELLPVLILLKDYFVPRGNSLAITKHLCSSSPKDFGA